MSKSLLLVPVLVASLAGTALAREAGEPAYVPTQQFNAEVKAEILPIGSFQSGELDTAPAVWGLSGWLGWEFVDRIEIGVEGRYIGNVKPDGYDVTASEINLIPKLAFHTRPVIDLDIAFSIGVGMSWIRLPTVFTEANPNGPVLGLGVSGAYPIGGGFLGVIDVGYQRGYQTTLEHVPGQPKNFDDQEFSTDFWHFGAGVAHRF